MASKDYQKLLNKYNMLLVHAQDMKERDARHAKLMEDKQKEFKKVNDAAKEFCEKIIRHSEKKKNAGDETSFTGDTYKLIIEAREKYDEKMKRDKENLRGVIQQNGELRKVFLEKEKEYQDKIDSLEQEKNIIQDQLNRTIKNGVSNIEDAEKYKKELEEIREEKAKEIQEKKERDSILNTLNKKTQNLIQQGTGNVDFSFDDEDMFEEGNPIVIEKEKTDPIGEKEKELKKENKETTPKKVTRRSISTSFPSPKEEKKEEHIPYTIDLTKTMEMLDDACWGLIKAIGFDGKSSYTEIERIATEKYNCERSRCRIAITQLFTSNLVIKELLKISLLPNVTLYRLSDSGKQIFIQKFKKRPKKSEMEILCSEHSSLEHGYGILALANKLKASGYYDDVCYIQQRKKTILPDGSEIIPDIILTTDEKTMYIEYERNTINQNGFNKKCRKMRSLFPVLNFIVENQTAMKEMCDRIDRWLTNDNLWETQNQLTIRISTARAAANADSLWDNKNWQVLYMKRKGKIVKIGVGKS